MSSYDSVYVAVKQIKEAAAVQKVTIPSLGQVSDQGPLTDSDCGIYGVTGPLCLDSKGNPCNKAVAIAPLAPTTRAFASWTVAAAAGP